MKWIYRLSIFLLVVTQVVVADPQLSSVPLEVQRMRAKAQNKSTVIAAPQAPRLRLTFSPVHPASLQPPKLPVPRRPLRKAVIYSGSLKANIQRIARRLGWPRVVWKVSNDYRWVGRIHLQGKDLPAILNKILCDYPLQAVFYRGNHVLVIVPRTLRS